MSLKKMWRAIQGMQGRGGATGVSLYKSWAAMEHEANLLWTNAQYYNEEGSDIYELAGELRVIRCFWKLPGAKLICFVGRILRRVQRSQGLRPGATSAENQAARTISSSASIIWSCQAEAHNNPRRRRKRGLPRVASTTSRCFSVLYHPSANPQRRRCKNRPCGRTRHEPEPRPSCACYSCHVFEARRARSPIASRPTSSDERLQLECIPAPHAANQRTGPASPSGYG